MRKSLVILSIIIIIFYLILSFRDYSYFKSRFSASEYYADTIIKGGYYYGITKMALIHEISKTSFVPRDIHEVQKNAISSNPSLDIKDYKKGFQNSFLYEHDFNIYIISRGTDNLSSFTNLFDTPNEISFFEYCFNIKDIVLAEEYYGIDNSSRWTVKLFMSENANVNRINSIDRLNKVLADERFQRFPKGYNYRKFYELGNSPDGFFVSFIPQFNSWRVLWVTEEIKEQNIKLDTVKLENLLNTLKNDSILLKADSIHFPYYLP
jgi:hypothetical protein